MIFFRLSGIKRAVIFKAALLVLLIFCSGEIHASYPVDISSKAGFDGKFRKGKGLPLQIILQNREERTIEGILGIKGGIIDYSIPVRLKPLSGNRKWIFVYPKAGSNLMLKFSSEESAVFQTEVRTLPLISRMGLAVYISRDRGKLRSFGSVLYKGNLFIEVTPRNLWNIWKGYDQADFVLLDADAVELMIPSQLKALKQYVLSGGSLYITGTPYPGIYKQDFFRDILPAHIIGLKQLAPGRLFPGSPAERVLSLQAADRRTVLHSEKGLILMAERDKGLGRVSLLSFDPANKSFYPLMIHKSNLWGGHRGWNKTAFIPESVWSTEIRALFLNIAKWNAGYLFLLSLIVLTGKKGARRTLLWSLTGILFLISSLASLGTLNGENRLKGISVINISDGGDAFLQSGLSIISARGGNVNAELHGGFLNPVPVYGQPAANEITLSEKGTKKITANLEFLNYNNFLWERFEKPETVLEVDLKVYPDKVKGYIRNLSEYILKNPFVMIRGRFFPLQPIIGGQQIPVEIIFGKDDSMLYPEGLQWIRSYIQSNEASAGLQGLKVLGLWEKPVLKVKERGLSMQEEKTVLLYHM